MAAEPRLAERLSQLAVVRLAVCRRRLHITDKVKRCVMEKQDGTCARCLEKVPDDKIEYDHIMALADGGGNEPENIQRLCRVCHAEKSAGERLTTYAAGCYSELALDEMEAIVEAPPHTFDAGELEDRILGPPSSSQQASGMSTTLIDGSSAFGQ